MDALIIRGGQLIDGTGAPAREDVEVEPGLATVYTTPTSFERVKKALEAAGIKTGAAELSMRARPT